jgi:putative hydrolase of the HAD superfamily
MLLTTLFFDLDATLYPSSNGLWNEIRNRIYQFMREQVGIPEDNIPETRDYYWHTYGTTLEGLRIHHQVEPDQYLDFVHNIPLEDYLQRDGLLREILESLPQDLWVFTNADKPHAERVLAAIGIQDLFNGIVDLRAMDFRIKPKPEAYRAALELSGSENPENCVMFDDLPANIVGAKEFGFVTALVGDNDRTEAADFHLPTIHAIKDRMPHLWNGK